MIRCARMWTDADGNSIFEEGTIALGEGERGGLISKEAVLGLHDISQAKLGSAAVK